MSVKKVLLLGAESTGKSTLAQALAAHYQTQWVSEYLREFVAQQGRLPQASEQLLIAQTQIAYEITAMVMAQNYLFCDTGPCMTALYSSYCFGECPSDLLHLAQQHRYDVVLVTNTDIAWQADGIQRDSPAAQLAIHQSLLNLLHDWSWDYTLVTGGEAERLKQVTNLLDGRFGLGTVSN